MPEWVHKLVPKGFESFFQGFYGIGLLHPVVSLFPVNVPQCGAGKGLTGNTESPSEG